MQNYIILNLKWQIRIVEDKTLQNSQKIENNNVVQQYSYCMKNYEEIREILKGFSV